MYDFYVWPDGTVQDVEDSGSEPFDWMSDDYATIKADSSEEAFEVAVSRGLV